ncbi:glycosyltransferase family A protein [Cochleicola gelatinilyticus]|uniref:Glycosyltransferase 2-like domain-containing protein n=1 Tax=Cochleicola gelatinilyticus TaxID=1763537 RepID=A0A167EPC7_9FLAO|nr:glycosyltransferase family A protein [Cochleicola gelatinilyticus]OAB75741.1 hypothetical protein ULVI_14800 [Cochleicola gelatinilyticus]
MRIGKNPAKEHTTSTAQSYHRVVVPVYIPNLEEAYFKEGLLILRYCLESLLKTVHHKTRISIFNNASCEEVSDYLKELFATHTAIDQLVHSKTNIGKINAIHACVRGQSEALITITDADVLFLNNWQQGVEKVFHDFPQAGMVSPVPVSNIYKHKAASSTFGYGFSKGMVSFENVPDPDALVKFQESVGANLFEGSRLKKFLCLKNKNGAAVLSCGHFVATLRSEVFQHAPKASAKDLISKKTDFEYIDKPNNELGYLRLATLQNYAYHLGNASEPWMHDIFSKISTNTTPPFFAEKPSEAIIKSSLMVQCYKLLHTFILQKAPIRKLYFRWKGMKDPTY